MPSKYSSGRRGRPEWRSASKYSSGRPATPVSASAWQTRVLPLRGVAQTMYERLVSVILYHLSQKSRVERRSRVGKDWRWQCCFGK